MAGRAHGGCGVTGTSATPDFVPVPALAEASGVSAPTLYRWIRAGSLAFDLSTGVYRVSIAEANRVIAEAAERRRAKAGLAPDQTRAVVDQLDAIAGDDPERAHSSADEALLSYVPVEVADAYRRVAARSNWWAAA
jgi:predicted DNA-binding transcriptional regulator AlpA